MVPFVTTAIMVNIMWGACDGSEGNLTEDRDCRLRLDCEKLDKILRAQIAGRA
jgi:hypothetical protein